jgi:glycerophosphoryl diester phosphodiesterase
VTAPGKPLVIGHRGASGYRPEHTRSAYELAFILGADAVEPDIVATADGVLVLRHENEISGTTDVAAHPEFASRKTTRVIDGVSRTGWFTEDFTWSELSTLWARERLPKLRQASSTFDGTERLLRLTDLLGIIDDASGRAGRELVLVAELKHATHFASVGLDLATLFVEQMRGWATPTNLVTESFEQTVLRDVKKRDLPGRTVFLIEASGTPADELAAGGLRIYADHLTDEGLARLSTEVDGVSVDKRMLLRADQKGTSDLVDRAHAAGLDVFTWTLRAENRFLHPAFVRGTSGREYGDWRGEFELLLSTGVDGVFTDQPDLVLAVLDGQRS